MVEKPFKKGEVGGVFTSFSTMVTFEIDLVTNSFSRNNKNSVLVIGETLGKKEREGLKPIASFKRLKQMRKQGRSSSVKFKCVSGSPLV